MIWLEHQLLRCTLSVPSACCGLGPKRRGLPASLSQTSPLLQDDSAEQAEEEITNGDSLGAPSAAALREACRCIAGSSAADALGVAFQCGMPGFAMPLAAAIWEQVKRPPPGSILF